MKAFSFFLMLWAPLAWAEVGVVTAIRGAVRVDGKSAQENSVLKTGSVVETGEGKCTLLMGKETIVHLDRGTRFVVKEYLARQGNQDPKAAFDLKYGRVRALIKSSGKEKKDFQFRTRAAVMGVRGTHVVLDVPRTGSAPESFVTLEGVAEVSFISTSAKPGEEKPSAPIQVKENQSLRVSASPADGGAPPAQQAPQNVNAEQVKDIAARVAPPTADVNTTREVRAWIEQGPPPAGFQDFANENPFRRPPGPHHIPFDPVADGMKSVNFSATVTSY
jgi:hypothetical protein